MPNFGIDISKWQGNFNFPEAIKEGVKFAIIRAAYAQSKDVNFEDNYKNAVAAGLPVGTYLYAMDKTPEEAKQTALWLVKNCLTGKTFDYPIYYDVEDPKLLALGKDAITKIVDAFCSTLESFNYFVGVYASVSTFDNMLDDEKLKRYTHWVAAWRKDPPTLKSGNAVDLWQYGGETNLIRKLIISNVVCDQDLCFVDFPSIIKSKQLNGYGKQKTIPADNPIVKGSQVIVLKAIDYEGKSFNNYYARYDVLEVKGKRVVIGIGKTVTCAINIANIKLVV